jgi:hypothetical protein
MPLTRVNIPRKFKITRLHSRNRVYPAGNGLNGFDVGSRLRSVATHSLQQRTAN